AGTPPQPRIVIGKLAFAGHRVIAIVERLGLHRCLASWWTESRLRVSPSDRQGTISRSDGRPERPTPATSCSVALLGFEQDTPEPTPYKKESEAEPKPRRRIDRVAMEEAIRQPPAGCLVHDAH